MEPIDGSEGSYMPLSGKEGFGITLLKLPDTTFQS